MQRGSEEKMSRFQITCCLKEALQFVFPSKSMFHNQSWTLMPFLLVMTYKRMPKKIIAAPVT